jgi:hypothetical protein
MATGRDRFKKFMNGEQGGKRHALIGKIKGMVL